MKKLKEAHASKLRKLTLGLFAFIALLIVGTTITSAHSFKDGAKIIAGSSVLAVAPFGMRYAPEEGGEQGGEAALVEKVRDIATKSGKEAVEAIKTEITKDVNDKISKTASVEQFEKLQKQFDDNTKATNEEIVKLKGLTEKAQDTTLTSGHKTLRDALESAFTTKTAKEKIDKLLNGESVKLVITVKSADTITTETTIEAGDTQVSLTQNTGIISTIRKRELRYEAFVSPGSISNKKALWIEEVDEEGTPIMIGEGDTKTQLDVQYVERTMDVKKIAVYGKVTTELLADLPQLISYIESNIVKRMDIVIENQLFSGNGTGDNLKGAISYASAFNAGSLADTIVDANELDVMEAIAAQVKRAFGNPNAIFVHPDTVSRIKLIKDDNGRPVWKDYVTITGQLVISGMSVIETAAITAGNYLGGDLSVIKKLNRDELGITLGLNGDDFIKNMRTMLCERRLVQFVSANDTACLVAGTFANDIVDLDSVLT